MLQSMEDQEASDRVLNSQICQYIYIFPDFKLLRLCKNSTNIYIYISSYVCVNMHKLQSCDHV